MVQFLCTIEPQAGQFFFGPADQWKIISIEVRVRLENSTLRQTWKFWSYRMTKNARKISLQVRMTLWPKSRIRWKVIKVGMYKYIRWFPSEIWYLSESSHSATIEGGDAVDLDYPEQYRGLLQNEAYFFLHQSRFIQFLYADGTLSTIQEASEGQSTREMSREELRLVQIYLLKTLFTFHDFLLFRRSLLSDWEVNEGQQRGQIGHGKYFLRIRSFL